MNATIEQNNTISEDIIATLQFEFGPIKTSSVNLQRHPEGASLVTVQRADGAVCCAFLDKAESVVYSAIEATKNQNRPDEFIFVLCNDSNVLHVGCSSDPEETLSELLYSDPSEQTDLALRIRDLASRGSKVTARILTAVKSHQNSTALVRHYRHLYSVAGFELI